MLHLTFYEKPDCHLCAEAHQALRRASRGLPLEVERVDITAAPREVHDRYALRIPVLAAGADELDAAGLADAVIMRWLRAHARDGRER